MRVGRIARINIVLNKWFLAVFFLFFLAGMADKVLLVFSAVLWHELAHILVAQSLGYKVKEIEFLPFGAVARIEGLTDANFLNEIVISAAGPLTSFGLAVLSYMAMAEFVLWREFLLFYYQVNLMLAIFNLLPALPLDGGRILRAVLAGRQDYFKATKKVVKFSFIISALLVVWAGVQYWFYNSFNITVMVAAVFLYSASKAELDIAGFRLMRLMSGKKAELSAKNIMPASYFTAVSDTAAGEVIRLFKPEEYHMVLVVDETEDFKLISSLTETQIWEAISVKGLNVKIGDI